MDGVFVGRSPQEIYDDSLCSLHDAVCRDLNSMCNGRMLFVREQRAKLAALRAEIERAIQGEVVLDTYMTWLRLVYATRP